jgi:hypothetical protein
MNYFYLTSIPVPFIVADMDFFFKKKDPDTFFSIYILRISWEKNTGARQGKFMPFTTNS